MSKSNLHRISPKTVSVGFAESAALFEFPAAAARTGIVAANLWSRSFDWQGVVLDVAIDIEPLIIFFHKPTDFVQTQDIISGKGSGLEFDNPFAVSLLPLFCTDNMQVMPCRDGGRVNSVGSGRGVPGPEQVSDIPDYIRGIA